jgi:hypothetical protein
VLQQSQRGVDAGDEVVGRGDPTGALRKFCSVGLGLRIATPWGVLGDLLARAPVIAARPLVAGAAVAASAGSTSPSAVAAGCARAGTVAPLIAIAAVGRTAAARLAVWTRSSIGLAVWPATRARRGSVKAAWPRGAAIVTGGLSHGASKNLMKVQSKACSRSIRGLVDLPEEL